MSRVKRPAKKQPVKKRPINAVEIGINLFRARREARMTQEQAGQCVGKTFQMIAKYEKGQSAITAEMLAALAWVYKQPPAFFFQRPV